MDPDEDDGSHFVLQDDLHHQHEPAIDESPFASAIASSSRHAPPLPPHSLPQPTQPSIVPAKRAYSPALAEFTGLVDTDDSSEDEALNQLARIDPESVTDDAALSSDMVRKMLRRMQKLEGALKKLKQERQQSVGVGSPAGQHVETMPLEHARQQNMMTGPNVSRQDQQEHQQRQQQQRQQLQQQQQQEQEHFASLEMLQAAQLAMPMATHPEHMSDSQTLASASNYAFDPAHIDPTLLPTVSPSVDQHNAQSQTPISDKPPLRKRRRKAKSKGEDIGGPDDDKDEADDEAATRTSTPKVRAPKAKKLSTPELNRAVLRRMYQLLNIKSPKDPLPHPHNPSADGADQNSLPSLSASYDATAPTSSDPQPPSSQTHPSALDMERAIAASQQLGEEHGGASLQMPTLSEANLEDISHMAFAGQDGAHGIDLSAAQSDENAAAVVMQLVMAAQNQGHAAAAEAAAAAARSQVSSVGQHGEPQHEAAPREQESLDPGGQVGSPDSAEQESNKPRYLDEQLDDEIAQWKGFVPNWLKKGDERNVQWVQAVASSVVRSPPAPDAKAKSIPSEHLADPSLALISAKTSFSNLCEKYRRQTDEVAKEKGARHKRLTRRKGRRAEKLMRRQKARQSDDFLATDWHRDHSNLDVDAALNLDYMSSEWSDDEEDSADFRAQAASQLPGVDLDSKTVLELRSPQWQSHTLFDLWNTLDTIYPVVLRKISSEHYFAPAHPRFRRNPLRDLPPRSMPSADWMLDPVWQATHAGVLADVHGVVDQDEGLDAAVDSGDSIMNQTETTGPQEWTL